jgi:hypothetical protein
LATTACPLHDDRTSVATVNSRFTAGACISSGLFINRDRAAAITLERAGVIHSDV